MSENIPDLTIEPLDPESGLILVQQDSGGNLDRVALHPVHVRRLAEKFGIAPSSDLASLRLIAALSRRLLLLRDRIETLHDMLRSVPCVPPGSGPTEDCVYSEATLQLANEFCTDLSARASSLGNSPPHAAPPDEGATLQVLGLAHSYFAIP
jgi:hypothetical protein